MSEVGEAIAVALEAKAAELKVAAIDVPRNADLYRDRASVFEVAAVIARRIDAHATPTTAPTDETRDGFDDESSDEGMSA